MVEEKFILELNEFQGDLKVLARICFALEKANSNQMSQKLKDKIIRELKKNEKYINAEENKDIKEIIAAFIVN